MPKTSDGITWAWMKREEFPKPCDFCGEPINKEHAYRVEVDYLDVDGGSRQRIERRRCERCLLKIHPPVLAIRWGLTRDVYSSDGEFDTWEAIGREGEADTHTMKRVPDFATLEEAYERAKVQTGRFKIVKWYLHRGMRHGGPCFSGWADSLPPIETVLARAEGTWIPEPKVLRPCSVCKELSYSVCETCKQPTCWHHGRFGKRADEHTCDVNSVKG